MASMLSSSDLHVLSVLIVLFLFSSLSAPTIADVLPSVPVTPGAACNSTPYPGFCKSILPNTPSANLFDYGRLSIKRSLSMTKKFSLLVDQYLRRRASYSVATVRALEDCRLLTDLNMDYLSTTFGTLNSSTSTLVAVEADEVQTLLSAIVTNQQTCMDGLQATSSAAGVENGLSTPLFNGTRLYRVSLALVTRAWIPKQRKKKKKKQQQQRGTTPRATERVLFSGLEAVRRGRLNLRMSDKNRRVYESASGRRLLQSTDSAFIREVVIVNQNGTDDFITISDAVAAAENNTDFFGDFDI
ncbi:hypothetical protein H6P81_003959 [Aristolochia fimbriata]|uniref:pectinesterase n=1 Tax=Aristolochia fimbriata TaxID=158543 RepID=A0AAV7FHC4_ARIFI|nr:hypothetical protein H6P81_003959 [Aristolochia fimbriata]